MTGEKPEAASVPPLPSCADDPVTALRLMFVDLVMDRRLSTGQEPALRPVFLKSHGVVHGHLEILPGLPAELRVGVFAGASYPAWVRFSSDTVPGAADLGTTLGIAIKLFGVPGAKLEGGGATHDFLLQNHDVFFVNTARDMCEFTRAGVVDGDYGPYLAAHPTTARILDEMRKTSPSVLAETYWSVLPYALGEGRHVKYKLEPFAGRNGAVPDADNPQYLQADLRTRLRNGEVRLRFLIQVRTDPNAMPLDQATVRWDEASSIPIHVATLVLPQQDMDARGQADYGENLSFNPWHALAEHAPQGSLSEARRAAYAAAADLRRHTNGIPAGEPEKIRPPMTSAAGRDRRVVRAAIHPAIGIARLGNSGDGYFLGPETVEPALEKPGSYRDERGALKRQAARFRIYGYNAKGELVGELTSNNADIRWTAHIANRKAAWYRFELALDIPEAASAPPSELRNKEIADRASLIIDPGPRTIRGRDKIGAAYAFDSGSFLSKPVYLGELRTDAAGRLIVLGGRGISASVDGAPARDFANNDGWHDDVSDGPVTAEVSIGGQHITVTPAWVVVAPPNYAPNLAGVRTMYDLLTDMFVRTGARPFPASISFANDVLPILRSLAGLQWVNAGFAAQFGWGSPNHFPAPGYLERLASAAPQHRELRRQVANAFRQFGRDGPSPVPWPWLYGDAMNIPPVPSPRQHVALADTQLRILDLWADGKFQADMSAGQVPLKSLDDVPLSWRPAMLDRAALHWCLADAFHPGCEMTWVMRHPTMYAAPYRICHREAGEVEPTYGTRLTPEMALSVGGPLFGQFAGSVTRWMPVPWQTDTASCRSGYYAGYGPRYDPYLPSFWPARVPNQVLTAADYSKVIDPALPREERRAAFARRGSWFRTLGPGDYMAQINAMVAVYGRMGVIEVRPGVAADPDFPLEMQVEDITDGGGPSAHVGLVVINAASDSAADLKAAASNAVAEGFPEDAAVVGVISKTQRFPSGLKSD